MSSFEDEPKTGRRFQVPHRGGMRVEVGEPVFVGGEKPWLCAVKLIGKEEPDAEATQTLYVRAGRGATPEEAQRNAMAQLSLVVGSPVGPAPEPTIKSKSDPAGG